jgi:hypothetical protein
VQPGAWEGTGGRAARRGPSRVGHDQRCGAARDQDRRCAGAGRWRPKGGGCDRSAGGGWWRRQVLVNAAGAGRRREAGGCGGHQ